MSEVYDADYYLHGTTSGKSLYENYRYLPALTIPMVQRIVRHCDIDPDDDILDFGAARGYVVKALHAIGYKGAIGVDVSEWAVANCDQDVSDHIELIQPGAAVPHVDWIIAKDVLEHVPEINGTINNLMEHARKGVFAVMPLSLFDGQPYIVASYERDCTHIHRFCLGTWAELFMRPGWSVEGRYTIAGVKDNYASWEKGNGFLTMRRLEK